MKEELNCDKFLDSISEYVDGVLSDALCLELERHMADCEDCRVFVDTFKKTIYLYHKTAAPTEIPVDVRERLFHSLELDDFIQSER